MNALNAAIVSQLAGGTALINALGGTVIYHMQAPDNQPLPYVVYSWQGGGHLNETPGDRIEVVEFVRVYHNKASAAGTIDDLVRARLHNQHISITGYTPVMCRREDDYEGMETRPNGEKVYAMGGFYRISFT